MASPPYDGVRRGLSIGAVLARAFAAIGTAPLLFFGTAAVFVAGPSVAFRLTAAGLFTPTNLGSLGRWWPWLAAGGLAWWVCYMTGQAVLFLLTAAGAQRQRVGVGELLGGAVRVLPLFVALSVLLTVAVALASVLLFVPGIILSLLWSVAAPALVIERTGLFAAFGRSVRLTAGARWLIFGLFVLVFAIYFVASGVVGVGTIAANGIASVTNRGGAPYGGAPYIVATIFSELLQLGFATVWAAIQAALFLELREWKEGPAGDRLAGIFA